MFTNQVSGGQAHRFAIQRAVDPTYASRINTGSHRGLNQDVSVTAGLRAGAAMKFGRHDLCPFHCNVAGQECIGAANPRGCWSCQIRVEVDDLHEPVNTGVRASGAQSGYLLSRELAQCSFQLVLDGLAGELALPTLVGLSVVADAEC